MRILTHNMLMCNVKGCNTNNFPLEIKATSIETIQSEFNPDLVKNLLPKLEWSALVQGCKDVRIVSKKNLNFLRQIYHHIISIFVL